MMMCVRAHVLFIFKSIVNMWYALCGIPRGCTLHSKIGTYAFITYFKSPPACIYIYIYWGVVESNNYTILMNFTLD